ncbi:hypothetical protein ACTPOK_19365 [Streptomyces inhibens]|uniref:hypothetical protein n=1 Tax=Streptomyces inhibens TaxID=2293571 RepID=UPI00402A810E
MAFLDGTLSDAILTAKDEVMNIKKITAAVGVATAGVTFAIATQGSAQAASAPQHTLAVKAPSQTAIPAGEAAASRSTKGDWNPPAGYVLERSFMGTDAACRKEGDRGVADGKWRQYVCHEKLVKVTDLWMLYQFLYVKK